MSPRHTLLPLTIAGSLLLVLDLASVMPVHAAELLLCQDSPRGVATRILMQAGTPGAGLTLAVADDALEQGCVSLSLDVPADAVHWGRLLEQSDADSPPASIILQGHFRGADSVVSEVILPSPSTPADASQNAPYLLVGDNLLAAFTWRTFGTEQRAVSDLATGLSCQPGSAAAGLLLQTTHLWPRESDAQLEVHARGEGTFTVALADTTRLAAESPVVLGTLSLSGVPGEQTQRFVVPRNDDHWNALTLLCPENDATLQLDALRLVPPNAPTHVPSAAWYWHPRWWREHAQALLDHAVGAGIDRLYLTFDLDADGRLQDADRIADFIAAARQRAVEVWAVYGDRSDVRPENETAVLRRAEAVLRYNRQFPQASIAGIQLDIEPYLMAGFELEEAYWQSRYRDVVNAFGARLDGTLPLEVVVPVWWAGEPLWGPELFASLDVPRLGITVMNYRTDLTQLKIGARPFLEWASRHDVPLWMALETGTLADEARKHFYPDASTGELWLLQLGGYRVLLLLDEALPGLPGAAYKLAFESQFNASALTFNERQLQLEQTLLRLGQDWSVWPAFTGFAVHGLDEDLQAILEVP